MVLRRCLTAPPPRAVWWLETPEPDSESVIMMSIRLRGILSLLVSLFAVGALASANAAPVSCTDSECDIRCNCSKTGNAACSGADPSCSAPGATLCEKIWIGD